jgi:WD40 repeat protein
VVNSGVGHRVHEVGSWNLVREIPNDENMFMATCAFDPKGKLAAMAISTHTVRLMDTADWLEIATINHPDRMSVSWPCFSPDGTFLAIPTTVHAIQLWDLPAVRQQLAQIGLDWDHPPYPPSKKSPDPPPRVVVSK